MDMWSDPNLSPFMAVTAHWIETTPVETPQGLQHTLKLRADLIGFQRVPGHHTVRNQEAGHPGKLATDFLQLLVLHEMSKKLYHWKA